MPLNVIRGIVSRKYTDFRGIDLLNAETQVDSRRSPDCLNVWKSYQLAQSNIIQTRPGIVEENDWSVEDENNTVYSFFFYGNENPYKIAHVGNKLIKDGLTPTTLYSGMAEHESEMVLFGNRLNDIVNTDLLILDGTHYIRYNGTTAVDVAGTMCYIPTTSISRSPSGRRN